MTGFGVGSVMFIVFALIGLVLVALGIVFLIKNIKWKKEKEEQGLSTTSNIIAMVLFGVLIFFGAIWLFCFGAGAVVFGVLGSSM